MAGRLEKGWKRDLLEVNKASNDRVNLATPSVGGWRRSERMKSKKSKLLRI